MGDHRGMAPADLTARVAAAQRISAVMPQLQASEAGLDALAESLLGFNEERVLVKVAALDGLYSTNVYAKWRMAEHVVRVTSRTDISAAGPELVDEMAALPAEGGKARRHTSFASKFAHFFIDRERFPIFDRQAEWAGKALLARRVAGASPAPYVTFADAVVRQRARNGYRGTARDLDRFLWLAGTPWQWLQGARVNVEVTTLLECPAAEVRNAVGLLGLSDLPRT